MIKRICVYCGSNPGKRPEYTDQAARLGHLLASRDIELVYGGASVGMMGAIADAVLERGGRVTGVIPKALLRKEVAHNGLDELIVVDSMHERKARMADLSDAFIAMPGGLGTLEELFEMLTWGQLGIHRKPVGVLNMENYFDHLEAFLNYGVSQGFIKGEHRGMLIVEDSSDILLHRFAEYEPPSTRKWLDDSGS